MDNIVVTVVRLLNRVHTVWILRRHLVALASPNAVPRTIRAVKVICDANNPLHCKSSETVLFFSGATTFYEFASPLEFVRYCFVFGFVRIKSQRGKRLTDSNYYSVYDTDIIIKTQRGQLSQLLRWIGNVPSNSSLGHLNNRRKNLTKAKGRRACAQRERVSPVAGFNYKLLPTFLSRLINFMCFYQIEKFYIFQQQQQTKY